MITETARLVLTSLAGSVCFLGCHTITGYVADPHQFVDRPIIMHRHPWIVNVTGPLSVLILIVILLNGWFIWRWLGVVVIFLFWILISNWVVKRLTTYRSTVATMYISNPFFQILVGGIAFTGLSFLNFVIR